MCYSKLLFLSASLLVVSSSVFAADMMGMEAPYTKNNTVLVQYRARNTVMYYSPQEPVREFMSDFKQQMGIPQETNIKIMVNGKPLDENRLCGSYQGNDDFGNVPVLRALVVR